MAATFSASLFWTYICIFDVYLNFPIDMHASNKYNDYDPIIVFACKKNPIFHGQTDSRKMA